MPIIYLSPSTQENNLYVSGGSEEDWMNRLADALEPYLTSCGIRYTRNTPEMTAASSIRASNAGNYDLHLALHSNAAPEGQYGQHRGILVFYFPTSSEGRRCAELIANSLKEIYPLPNLVRAEPNTTVGEVRRVRAPSVFIELGYHDNGDDAAWIVADLDLTARTIALSLTEFFSLPFLAPGVEYPAQVAVAWGSLNLRDRPNVNSAVLAQAPNGASLTVISRYEGWCVVRYNGLVAWANGEFIQSL